MRASSAAMRSWVPPLRPENASLSLSPSSALRVSNSFLPLDAIFSAMARASAELTLPCFTKSASAASAFSVVITAAPTPASSVFLMVSIMMGKGTPYRPRRQRDAEIGPGAPSEAPEVAGLGREDGAPEPFRAHALKLQGYGVVVGDEAQE